MRQEYVRCGNAGCHCHLPGDLGHGPYWYAYFRDARGRRHKRYIGTSIAKFLEKHRGDDD